MSKSSWQPEHINAPTPEDNIIDWLERQMSAKRPFLLAHADDGIIWGKRSDDGRLITSNDLAPRICPSLRWLTLQQAFIFGEQGEVRLWRGSDGWQARLITGDQDAEDTIEETHVLWGTKLVGRFPEGFSHVRESRQHGLDHVVPVEIKDNDLDEKNNLKRRIKLLVRHHIEYDESTGEARIALSRLVDFVNSDQEEDDGTPKTTRAD